MAVTSGKAGPAGTKAASRKASSLPVSAAPVKTAPVKAAPAKPVATKAVAPKVAPVKAVAKTAPAPKSVIKATPAAIPAVAKPVAPPAPPVASKAPLLPVKAKPAPVAIAKPAPAAPVIAPSRVSTKAPTPSTLYRVENAMQITKEQIEKASQTFFKGYEDLASLGKGNVEAVVKSSAIVARGFEEMGRQIMALAQANMEHGVAAAKAAMNCTTLKQIVELQNDFAKTSFDKAMAEGNKLSELSVKVANEAIEPIQARVNVAVGTFVKPVAA